jgi:hypothetical protein
MAPRAAANASSGRTVLQPFENRQQLGHGNPVAFKARRQFGVLFFQPFDFIAERDGFLFQAFDPRRGGDQFAAQAGGFCGKLIAFLLGAIDGRFLMRDFGLEGAELGRAGRKVAQRRAGHCPGKIERNVRGGPDIILQRRAGMGTDRQSHALVGRVRSQYRRRQRRDRQQEKKRAAQS